MSVVDDILALHRLEQRLGYTVADFLIWSRYDRCCHGRRSPILPKPLW